LLVKREQARHASVVLALICEGCWPLLVVASRENPDPVGAVACDLGSLPDSLAASQQPDDLSVAAFDRIGRFAVSLL
jgi:hypothetical protein